CVATASLGRALKEDFTAPVACGNAMNDQTPTTDLPEAVVADDNSGASSGAPTPTADAHIETPQERLERIARERNALGRNAPLDGIVDWSARPPRVDTVLLAAAIEAEDGRFRTGPDKSLYRYSNGVYLPDGEE